LNGVRFDFIADNPKTGGAPAQVGFIAQEVEEVLPEVVATGDSGYKSVSYQNLSAVLVEAVKEQQRLIEAQQAQIERLNQRIEALEAPPPAAAGP
jgi:hypothetical protein